MSIDILQAQLRDKVSAEVRVAGEGDDRYRVFTPFMFDDGDHLSIVLKRIGGQWILSDESNTFMHLSYELDDESLREGTRQKIISSALSLFDVAEHDGELTHLVRGEEYGDALHTYVQALLRIADIT